MPRASPAVIPSLVTAIAHIFRLARPENKFVVIHVPLDSIASSASWKQINDGFRAALDPWYFVIPGSGLPSAVMAESPVHDLESWRPLLYSHRSLDPRERNVPPDPAQRLDDAPPDPSASEEQEPEQPLYVAL